MIKQHWEKNYVKANQRELRYCPHCHQGVWAIRTTRAWIRLVRQQGFKQFKFSNRNWRCPYCEKCTYDIK